MNTLAILLSAFILSVVALTFFIWSQRSGIFDRSTEGAADEGAAGQVLLGDDHVYSTLARATLLTVSAGSSLVRIWNGALSIIPMMIDVMW